MVNQSGQDHCDPSPETTERTGLPGATLVQASGDMGNGEVLQTADFHFWARPAGFGLFLPVPLA
jgi:hypothetical protein